jgi:hypothetical protein
MTRVGIVAHWNSRLPLLWPSSRLVPVGPSTLEACHASIIRLPSGLEILEP